MAAPALDEDRKLAPPPAGIVRLGAQPLYIVKNNKEHFVPEFSPVDLWIGFASLLAFQTRSLVLNCPSPGKHKFACRGLAAEEIREAPRLLWPLIALHGCAES